MRLYRVARPASHRRHLLATLAWMVIVWTAALAVLPALLRALERRLGVPRAVLPGGRPVGAALLVAASAFGVRCAIAMARGEGTPVPFDAAARLVVTGPYRRVRNPMALSGTTQAAGVALLVGSPLYYPVPVLGGLLWHLVIRPSEEAFLLARFGAAYAEYREAVPLWVPRRRGHLHGLRQSHPRSPRPGRRGNSAAPRTVVRNGDHAGRRRGEAAP